MYLAAHPDDENTRLISYLVHERKVRTIYYSLTRGDGGQNIIGNEQGRYLGLIRTLEMNEARRLDGAEQLYGSAIDFGFTKNPDEVFTKWNKKQLIKEIKYTIQQNRPDVIILRFPTTGEGGHGQHTASAILALEAYKELVQESKVNTNLFVPTRILFNAFNFGGRSTQKEDQLKITINQYNSLLGKSYGQLAGESRSMHKSQGAGTPQSFGIYQEYFQHLAGKEANNDILNDINISWTSLGFPEMDKSLDQIIENYDYNFPNKSISQLVQLYKKINSIKSDNYNIKYKQHQLMQTIIDAAQISLEALAQKPIFYSGDTINTEINIAARAANIKLASIYSDPNNKLDIQKNLYHDSLYSYNLSIVNTKSKNFSQQPYWLIGNNINNDLRFHFPNMVALNESNPTLEPKELTLNLVIEDQSFHLTLPIQYKRLDPLRGDVVNNIHYRQNINLSLLKSLAISNDRGIDIPIKISTHNMVNEPIEVWTKQKDKHTLWGKIKANKSVWDSTFSITLDNKNIIDNQIEIYSKVGDNIYNGQAELIKYDHIPETQYTIPSIQKVVKKEWISQVKNIGYIQGADDLVDDVLKSLDFKVVNLSKTDFQNQQYIQSFDAIVVGIRAYNVNEDINFIHPLLMKYIENGGTVVVQYNTDKNLKVKEYGPYPFEISRNRITLEDAPTTIINKEHKLLNYPNKINQQDWQNWVQERGIYYPSNWHNKYQTLIKHQEFEEQPLESGILYTQYGKGHYIYTPLAFFRQLPDGHPGAIKLFINFLSVGK